MRNATANSLCYLALIAAIINSRLSLTSSVRLPREFNAQPARHILGYECKNPKCRKLFAKTFACDQHRNHATTRLGDSLRKYRDARQNFMNAPFGYVNCCIVDTDWSDTQLCQHMHTPTYTPFNTVELHSDSFRNGVLNIPENTENVSLKTRFKHQKS